MRCPHCAKHIHESWSYNAFVHGDQYIAWRYRCMLCPSCTLWIIEIREPSGDDWRQVEPLGSSRAPCPTEVPAEIADDYREACRVLPLSAKASAALARRCLQSILHAHSYKDRDLGREIDLLLNEPDLRKAIPDALRQTVDGIRHFGNFSAHPITDKTSLQVIDVEDHEAEWCLDLVEEMFEHFYVRPAQAKARKAALDAKLAAAGKPPSKGQEAKRT